MKIMLDEGAKMPTRAHEMDAGLDLYARTSCIVEAKDSATFDTGVHVAIPEGFVGFLKSKSGLNVRHGIVSDGVIDAGYTGSIVVKLHNLSGFDYRVNAGDRFRSSSFCRMRQCRWSWWTASTIPPVATTDLGVVADESDEIGTEDVRSSRSPDGKIGRGVRQSNCGSCTSRKGKNEKRRE